MLELNFPRLITAPNSRSVLKLCNRAIRRRQPQITFDLTSTEFITPFGVTVIAGTITKCLRSGKEIIYRPPRRAEVQEWLSSIGFLDFFQMDRIGAQRRGTGIELRQLRALDPIYIDNLVALIDHHMNLSGGVRDSIRLSVQELLTNAFDHSKSDIGCFVCAQFTPRRQLMRLSVTDFGIGILRALRSVKEYSNLRNSHEAITRAVEEGVSSRKGRVAGIGLSHIRRFARVNQGTMTVISGNGKVNFYSKSIEPRPMPSEFKGTAIELKINADKEGFYFLTGERESLF
jgi:anti-anti-sigma regulatory factor